MRLGWEKRYTKRIIAAIISGIIGVGISFIVVKLFFPDIHWLDNLVVILTITGVKIVWNILVFPLYKGYLK